ncbi:hypothetical protein J1N35_014306 [Gossypium stocksii]|uniref:Uncharacterized protein n=1 Tax=Gossypium stocksii TaxID=47602 RepID=A0A9D4A8R6_9ROSI|nr:hypothetical protein J1N35_014306 [Gossypium stocksii]
MKSFFKSSKVPPPRASSLLPRDRLDSSAVPKVKRKIEIKQPNDAILFEEKIEP